MTSAAEARGDGSVPVVSFEASLAALVDLSREPRTANHRFAMPSEEDAVEPWAALAFNPSSGYRGARIVGFEDGEVVPDAVRTQPTGEWHKLHPVTICGVFANQATSPGELAAVSNQLFQVMAAAPNAYVGSRIQTPFNYIVRKALELRRADPSSPDIWTYFQTGPEVAPTYQIPRLLDAVFNKMLVRDKKEPEDHKELVRAFAGFDEHGLVSDRFWNDYAHGATVLVPELLPLLVQKISSPDAARIWADTDTVGSAQNYMMQILKQYLKDGSRVKKNVETLIQKSGIEGGVRLDVLVRTANSLTAKLIWESRSEAVMEPFRPKPLDVRDPAVVASAFLRVLETTRNPNSRAISDAQHAQDLMYADVLAFLYETTLDPRRKVLRTLGSLALHHRPMTTEQIQEAMTMLGDDQPLPKILGRLGLAQPVEQTS